MPFTRLSGVVVALVIAGLAGCGAGVATPSPLPVQGAPDLPDPAISPPPAWSKLTPMPPVTAPFSGVGNQFIFAATAYRDGFVTVGEDLRFDGPVDGAIWTSPDGLAWARLDVAANDLADAELDLVATDGARLVAIGGARAGDDTPEQGDRIVWVSDDGAAWRRIAAGVHPFDAVYVTGLTAGRTGFVAWGNDGTTAAVFSSADGVRWTRAAADPSFTGATITMIAPFRGGFVAIGAHRPVLPPGSPLVVGGPDTSSAAAWWSADGLTWSAANTDAGAGLHTLMVGANGLLAVGGSGCGGCIGPGIVWHSDDGRHWRRVGPDAPDPRSPNYASDGARIVRYLPQDGGKLETSADGTTWKSLPDVGQLPQYGLVVGLHGILVLESIVRGGPQDEVDGGVLYVAAE